MGYRASQAQKNAVQIRVEAVKHSVIPHLLRSGPLRKALRCSFPPVCLASEITTLQVAWSTMRTTRTAKTCSAHARGLPSFMLRIKSYAKREFAGKKKRILKKSDGRYYAHATRYFYVAAIVDMLFYNIEVSRAACKWEFRRSPRSHIVIYTKTYFEGYHRLAQRALTEQDVASRGVGNEACRAAVNTTVPELLQEEPKARRHQLKPAESAIAAKPKKKRK